MSSNNSKKAREYRDLVEYNGDNIPEGYLWCNYINHIGDNPFPGKKEDYFSDKRNICRVCYNTNQRINRRKKSNSESSTTSSSSILSPIQNKINTNINTRISNYNNVINSLKTDIDKLLNEKLIAENKLSILSKTTLELGEEKEENIIELEDEIMLSKTKISQIETDIFVYQNKIKHIQMNIK